MWVFTRYGFFSVVAARTGSGRPGDRVDPERVMVRSRVREHLEALQDRCPELLGAVVIHESASTDYAYRLFIEKAVWVRVLAALAADVDYDNFKAEVARPPNGSIAGRSDVAAIHHIEQILKR